MNTRAVMVCDQWLGSNGYAALKALRRAGWAVDVVPEWEYVPVKWRSIAARAVGRLVRPIGVGEFNRQLIRSVERHRPAFLLVFKGTFVCPETIRAIREYGARTYCFFPDVSFYVHGKYLPATLPQYDWIFTTKRFGIRDMHERLGVKNASVLLHAYDADLHRPTMLEPGDVERYACDVSFIGTWSPKKQDLLRSLLGELPSLKLRIWGEQWRPAMRDRVLASAVGGHEVVGEEYVRAITASAINLGILSERRPGASSGDKITSRTFHIPAAGGFMLHERTDELLEIFQENESVACYGDARELAAQVRKYLARPTDRQEIAGRGRTVVASHSWDHRIQMILTHHARSLV